ncbi:nitrogenase component 1 [Rubrivivax sp. JA1024]|nr:nitrogenase component 1 [Rubrivivax sp. JA1024]
MTKPLQLPTRERRLNALSAYLGDVTSLIAEFEDGPPVTRIRTFSQVAVDDVSAALQVLTEIDGLGVVVHGARGCAGALAAARADRPWAVTNLDQRDTILGADGALARTLRQLHRRHQPWAIVVVATPVVAINNDDIQAVAEELSDELGIPVIELRTDGFRSRVAATGFDVAAQAIAALVQPGHSHRRDLINLLAFEHGPGFVGVAQAIESLGLEINVFPVDAGPTAFAKAAQAALSVAVFEDETDALRRELDRLHGVPFLRLPPPVGAEATRSFVAAIAAATERPAPPSGATGEDVWILNGRRVVVALPPSQALAVVDLVDRFGGELAGLSVDWIDSLHLGGLRAVAAAHPELPLHVAAGQPFELMNWVGRIKPEVVIGTPVTAATANRAGIAAVAVGADDLLGAAGEARLASRLQRLLDGEALKRRFVSPTANYLPGWLKRSPDWHIKREVR